LPATDVRRRLVATYDFLTMQMDVLLRLLDEADG
jgi:hypothetical protein